MKSSQKPMFSFAIGDIIMRLKNLKEVHNQVMALLPVNLLLLEDLCGPLRDRPFLLEIHIKDSEAQGHQVCNLLLKVLEKMRG